MYTQDTLSQPQTTIPVGEHLFDEVLHFTDIADYGYGMQAMLTGQAPVPPAGARFDIYYEGAIEGERIRGTLKGVDFAVVRADGRFQLDIRAALTTDDGARLALYADGIMKTPGAKGRAELRLNMQLTTAEPAYTWVNALQVWGYGNVDLNTGQIRVSTFVA